MGHNLFIKLGLFIFLNTVVNVSYCNKKTLDSLQNAYYACSSIEDKVNILDLIFSEVQDSDASKALAIAEEFKNTLAPLHVQYNLKAMNYLGIAYMNLNYNDSAYYYFNNLLMLSAQHNDSLFISKAYNNLGALNFNMGDYQNAIYYIHKGAAIDEKLGDAESSVINLLNIGALYHAMGNSDSAKYYIQDAIKVASLFKDESLMATGHMNFGVIEFALDNSDAAISHLNKAIELGNKTGNNDILSMSYRNMALIYQRNGKYGEALGHDYQSLDYAIKSNSLDNIMAAKRGIAYSYEQLGRYKEALFSYKEFISIKDSLEEIENNQITLELKEKYMSDQARIENQVLTQKNKIKDLEIEKGEEEIRNSKIIIISSVLGLVLLLMLAFVLYNRNLIKQKANKKLQDAYAIIQEKNLDILSSIDYASKIQEALLPTKENPNLFADSFFMLKPKDIVSGDFIWYAQVENKKIIAVVDCTGHGVPGAFMSMIGNTFLHQIVNEKGIVKPNEILNELRNKVILALNQKSEGIDRKDGMDMTICVIDENKSKFQFAGANNPCYFFSKETLIELKGDKQPVGFFQGEVKPFSLHEMDYSNDDVIYLFSDGYVDQFGGPKGKKFKHKQLQETLEKIKHLSMQDQKKTLTSVFDDWKGELEQIDDVCIVGVRLSS